MIDKINRFERKWIYRSSNYISLINSLIRSKLFFQNQYPYRKVNSIYFDTNNYTSIRQNLDGISEKKKVRIRWYGDQNKLINPVLEVKSKKGSETKKEIYEINELNNLSIFDSKNLELITIFINSKNKTKNIIHPMLTTNYERQYFISNNNKVRATVDYNLKSTYLKNQSQKYITKNFLSSCILELKYSTILDKYVRRNLDKITLRLSKNSKFINSAFETPSYFS